MAYNTIPSTLIQVGKAITRTLFSTYIKDNLDDLNSRILTVEATGGKVIIFDEIVINAATLESGGSISGLDIYRIPSSFDLIDAKIYIFEKGSLTGNLEMDIKVSSSADFTSAVSVFTTKPKIDYSTASDYDESTNAVFDITNKVMTAGEYLKLDITELPANGSIGKFGVYLIGEAS